MWSFVRRPFPSLDENQILALVEYHTPNFFDVLVILVPTFRPSLPSCSQAFSPSPFGRSGWRGGGAISHPSPSSRRGRLIPNKRPRPSSSGWVHHPVEAREIFSPSWLTIPERGLYTGVAIFGAVGSGKTSGLHEPVCPAASRLASGQSEAAGGGAGARSQGRLLPRHPPNSGRGGPWTRLH